MSQDGPAATRWDDLLTRLATGAVIAAVGIAAVWAGGVWFRIFTTLAGGLMVWELARMVAPAGPARRLGLGAGAALALAEVLPAGLGLPLLMLPGMVGFALLQRERLTFGVFALAILLAAYGLFDLRAQHGFFWIFWLICVVVVTDVAGYFAGRLIGGPKFWPRVSPKKTWSGTAAGWVGAGLVGWLFTVETVAGPQLIGVSIAASMASQMGDITESALKRRVGVKDSSNLLPGHGGLFDRFDGMLGASVFVLLMGDLVGVPPQALG